MTKQTILSIPSLECLAKNKTILNVSDISIKTGELNAIIGPNGAGKSTLLKAVSGDIRLEGKIFFHDRDLKTWPAYERARHIGVLPQSSALSFPFSAHEVVALGLTPLSLSAREAARSIKNQMEDTGCWHLSEKPYPMLSGGEKQRVQLARVLLQLSQAELPPLLLLDEPTSAQDLGQQHSILTLVKALCDERGYGVMAILHDLNQVLRYCDSCYVLGNGRVKHEGSPSKCLSPSNIEAVWGYRPEMSVRDSLSRTLLF